VSPLDLNYWNAAKRNGMIKVWLQERYISVDLRVEPKAEDGPTAAELAVLPTKELEASLVDAPKAWAVAIQVELDRRKADLATRVREDLTGLKVEEALPLIVAETSAETLERWSEADKRKTIGEAIDERLGDLILDEDEDSED